MAARLVVLAAALGFAALAAAQPTNCKWDSGMGASFDLTALSSGTYSVIDGSANQYSHNYTYVFGICANTNSIPTTAYPNYQACVNTTGSGNKRPQRGTPSPAYQIFNRGNLCHRLGDSAADSQFALFDPNSPVRGITLTYLGGDVCPYTWGNRTLAIHFICFNDAVNIPDTETVAETDNCHYEIYLRSIFGCPTECFGSLQQLCSNAGVCGYDTDAKKARCFCNSGSWGTYCENSGPQNSGNGAVTGVLIFVCVLLAALLGALLYLWMRIRSLRLDTSAYSTLAAGPEHVEQGGDN